MLKKEVRVGSVYQAKVNDKPVQVRIERVHPQGGWHATNLATGKKVRIPSAQRLLAPVEAKAAEPATSRPAKKAKSSKPASTPPVAAPVAAPPAKPSGAAKPLSQIAAAALVLADAGEPLNCPTMVERMTAAGYWTSPGGKTPASTLHAAIQREIHVKGSESRFAKVGKGTFALAL